MRCNNCGKYISFEYGEVYRDTSGNPVCIDCYEYENEVDIVEEYMRK